MDSRRHYYQKRREFAEDNDQTPIELPIGARVDPTRDLIQRTIREALRDQYGGDAEEISMNLADELEHVAQDDPDARPPDIMSGLEYEPMADIPPEDLEGVTEPEPESAPPIPPSGESEDPPTDE